MTSETCGGMPHAFSSIACVFLRTPYHLNTPGWQQNGASPPESKHRLREKRRVSVAPEPPLTSQTRAPHAAAAALLRVVRGGPCQSAPPPPHRQRLRLRRGPPTGQRCPTGSRRRQTAAAGSGGQPPFPTQAVGGWRPGGPPGCRRSPAPAPLARLQCRPPHPRRQCRQCRHGSRRPRRPQRAPPPPRRAARNCTVASPTVAYTSMSSTTGRPHSVVTTATRR